MIRKNIGLFIVAAALLFIPKNANATELLTNGSFETGNFTGWTTNSTQSSNYCTNWAIASLNSQTCTGSSTAPVAGTFDALNGFDGSGGEFTMYQDVAIPAATSARLTFSFRAQWNIPTLSNLARRLDVQIRNPGDNSLLETVYTFNANPGSNQTSGWVTQQMWISQYAGQTIRLYFVATIPQSFTGPGQLEIDGVRLESFFPTAAHVGVRGMVTNANGYGIGNASVSFVDNEGQTRFTRTNPFGHFSFDEVEVGQTYVFEVRHKQYNFPDSPRVVNLEDGIDKMVFTAAPDLYQKRE